MSAIITNFSAPDGYEALTDCFHEGGSNLALLFMTALTDILSDKIGSGK